MSELKCKYCGGELCKEVKLWEGKPPTKVCKIMYEGIKEFIEKYDTDNDVEITDTCIRLRRKE